MTAITVFVDEAVEGTLPHLCVVSGRPTEDALVIRHGMGDLNPAVFLLFFLGPPGWLLLAALVFSRRAETLVVTVPFHDDEYQRYRRARRSQAGLMAAGVAALALSFAFIGKGQGVSFLLMAVGCVLACAVIGAVTRRRQPGIDLDASRRWVTLWRVHPDFADAYKSSRSASRESMSGSDLSGR